MTESAQTTQSALLISHLFPPVGGSGVQRNVKYAKYLPNFAWKPYVLTVKDILYHSYDPSLLLDVSPDTTITRTESIDPYRVGYHLQRLKFRKKNSEGIARPGVASNSWALSVYRKVRDYILFPDAAIGWLPFACKAGRDLIENHGIRVIVASVGPYSSALIARRLSKTTGIPYVLDFRDGWTDDPYLHQPTAVHKYGHRKLERSVIVGASAVAVYGEYLRDALAARYPMVQNRLHVVTNGYDLDDMRGIVPQVATPGRRRIVYCGSVYEHHACHFAATLKAIAMLPEELRKRLEVVFVGRIEVKGASELISFYGLHDQVTLHGYCPHRDALEYLSGSDASLLYLPKGDMSSYTGKVFEYLMVGNAIIAFSEAGSLCSNLLDKLGQSKWIAPPTDPTALCNAIKTLDACGWPKLDSSLVAEFDRKRLAERLAGILSSVTDIANASAG